MGESKHKCSALESSMYELPAFEKFVVICGHLGGILSHLQLREGLFYSRELRNGVCKLQTKSVLHLNLLINVWFFPKL